MKKKILFLILFIISKKNIFCSENNNPSSENNNPKIVLNQLSIPIKIIQDQKYFWQNNFSFLDVTNIKTLTEFSATSNGILNESNKSYQKSKMLFSLNQNLLQILAGQHCGVIVNLKKIPHDCSTYFFSTSNTGNSTNMLPNQKCEEAKCIEKIQESEEKIKSRFHEVLWNVQNFLNAQRHIALSCQFRITSPIPQSLNNQQSVLPLYNSYFDMYSSNNLIGTGCKNLDLQMFISNIMYRYFPSFFVRKSRLCHSGLLETQANNKPIYVSHRRSQSEKLLNIPYASEQLFEYFKKKFEPKKASFDEEKRDLLSKNKQLAARIKTLEEEKEGKHKELEESTQAQESLKLEIDELKTQLKQKDEELKSCIEKWKTLDQLKDKQNSEHQAKVKALESELENLKKEIENIKIEKEKIENEKITTDKKIKTLEEEKGIKDRQLEESTQAQEILRLEFDKLKKEFDAKDKELKSCTEKFEVELNELKQQQNSEHQAKVKALESELENLKKEIENIKIEKEKIENEKITTDKKIETLEEEKRSKDKQIEASTQAQESLKLEIDELKKQLELLRKELETLQNKKNEDDQIQKNLQTELNTLKNQYQKIEEEKTEIENELKKKKDLSEIIKNIKTIEQNIVSRKNDIKNISFTKKIIFFRSDDYKKKKNELEELKKSLVEPKNNLLKELLGEEKFNRMQQYIEQIEKTGYFSRVQSFFGCQTEYNAYKNELREIYKRIGEDYCIMYNTIPQKYQDYIMIDKNRNFFFQIKDLFMQKSFFAKMFLVGTPASLGVYFLFSSSNSFLSNALSERISSFIEDYNIKEKFPSITKYLAIFFGIKKTGDIALRVVSSENPCGLYPSQNCSKNINRNSIFCQNCSKNETLAIQRQQYIQAQVPNKP